MEKRNRAWRRSQVERIQVKRQKKWSIIVDESWSKNPKIFGKFKKSNFSCGCILCKPWKHGRKD